VREAAQGGFHPYAPTRPSYDMQAQFMAINTVAEGTAVFRETFSKTLHACGRIAAFGADIA